MSCAVGLIVESEYALWYAQKYEKEQSGATTVVPAPAPESTPTVAGKHVPMFGAVNTKYSVVLLTGQPFALMTLEISCCSCASVTQPAAPPGLPSAATGVSGQLTGSRGGSAFVSIVVPANVVLFWTYVFV